MPTAFLFTKRLQIFFNTPVVKIIGRLQSFITGIIMRFAYMNSERASRSAVKLEAPMALTFSCLYQIGKCAQRFFHRSMRIIIMRLVQIDIVRLKSSSKTLQRPVGYICLRDPVSRDPWVYPLWWQQPFPSDYFCFLSIVQ